MSDNRRQLRLIDYLDHMLDAVQSARRFVRGLSKGDFLADEKTRKAVVPDIEVIGEAATQLVDRYSKFAEQHPEVPWRQMRGMRNRMVHGYFYIDYDVVWNTIEHALPDLESKILNIRQNLQQQQSSPYSNEG